MIHRTGDGPDPVEEGALKAVEYTHHTVEIEGEIVEYFLQVAVEHSLHKVETDIAEVDLNKILAVGSHSPEIALVGEVDPTGAVQGACSFADCIPLAGLLDDSALMHQPLKITIQMDNNKMP